MGKTIGTRKTVSFSENAKPPLSLVRCRAILGTAAPESDGELTRLRDQLYGLARVVVEALPGNGRLKRLSRAPNGTRRAFDDVAKDQTAPASFSEALASVPEDERYDLLERASILEYDSKLDRDAAERLAFSEYWRAKHARALQ